MADLRDIKRLLAQSKRKQEEYEAELRRAKVQPKLEVMTRIWMKDDKFCEKFDSLTNDDAKILARKISESLDEILENAESEMEEARAKRKEKLERQKANRAKKQQTEVLGPSAYISHPDDDDKYEEEEVEMVIDPDYGLRVPRKDLFKTTDPKTGEELVFLNGRVVR